ncbi:putative RAD50 protein [Xylariomycetidae sp. FL2044]|nr:putative RAD50 protein [Xylariomycetidae sp. FL2044]
MSKIDKLSIRGIRSFSAISNENIQFHTPLTLIVGYNGSGKTTIIECLKYATTGEQPPNSKGGAFIHDPKLTGEREVLAQVRLRFATAPEVTHTVTRNLQLTVKKTSRSSKTLEGSISTNREGEKSTSSSIKVNLDTLVPQTLGVVPAILESVIFCHQDESLWPLSEPAVLKKRFDAIFEADRFTKAIDNLKMLRKKQGEKLQKLKIEEARDKEDKQKADKCEKRSIELQDEIEKLRLEIEEFKRKIEEAGRNARQLHEQANSSLKIVNDLKYKEQQLSMREDHLNETKSRMDELAEPDEWLQDALAQYEERIAQYRQDHDQNEAQYRQQKEDLAGARQTMSERLAEQGRHDSDKAKYERELASRLELVRRAAQLHRIRGFEGDLDDQKVKSFDERIQNMLADKKRELEALQGENTREVDEKTAVITELEGQKSRHTMNRVNARQQIGRIEKQVSALQRALNSVEVDEGAKALLDSQFEDTEQRLRQASQEFQDADLDKKLQQENEHWQQLEGENRRLGRELQEATKLLSDRAQLEVRKAEVEDKKRRLDTLTNAWNDKITSMVNQSWQPATLEREFQKAVQQRVQAYDEATRKRDETAQQLKQAQYALSSAKETAKSRNVEIEKCKSLVILAIRKADTEKEPDINNLPSLIEQKEKEVLDTGKELALYEHLENYYTKCQETLNARNCCDLCRRPFTDASQASKLVAKIKKVLDGTEVEELQSELAKLEQVLGSLQQVRPQRDTYDRLMAEKAVSLPAMRRAEEEEEAILRCLEEMDEIVRERQETRQNLESMNKTILGISQLHRDIEEAETQVDRIVSQQQSTSTIRSTTEIHEQQEQCARQMEEVKERINKLSNDKQRLRDKLNSLELQRSELKNKMNDAAHQLKRKQDFQNQIQAMKDDMSKQKEIIQQADGDLVAVEPEISKARMIRDDVLQRGRAREKNIAEERDGLASSVNELKMMGKEIQNYLDRDGPSLRAANERAIQSLKNSMERIEKDMNGLVKQINKLKEEVVNSDGKKKNIMDNLSYRKTLRDIEELRRDVETLKSRKAHEDYERLEAEADEFDRERHLLDADKGISLGSIKTKNEELTRLLEDWETHFQDAAQKYRETHIKVETTKAAIEDLGRYSTALSNAVMQFHARKIAEVNRIAGDIWQSTYQGTDIDTILIKSDSENTAGRSSYNYRVCMMKTHTEMDMRGRCSAGQKVLASIIIRLALAESFGIGCGLIALDEPTTNLDRDNIRSLAESLHGIIQARRAQSNFQLIVITHDEEFLRHMRCSDFCDNFWRVRRNENQNSVIEKEPINNIF